MEIEELKELWTQSSRRLEASLRLNALLLQQANLEKAGRSLRSLSGGIVAELVVNVIGLMLLGSFAADHAREPRYLVPALVLGAYAVAVIGAGVAQLAALGGVDYDEPVVVTQTKLERLRLFRIRTTGWTLLFAPLMWVPLLIVTTRGIFGIDIYAAGVGWIAANALFGLAVIPLAIVLARRYGARLRRVRGLQSLADLIAGRALVDALDSIDTIRRFEG